MPTSHADSSRPPAAGTDRTRALGTQRRATHLLTPFAVSQPSAHASSWREHSAMKPMQTAPRSAAPALRPQPARAQRRAVARRAAAVKLDYDCKVFEKELVDFAGESEFIVKGGRDKFALLPKAFEGIKEVRGCRLVACGRSRGANGRAGAGQQPACSGACL